MSTTDLGSPDFWKRLAADPARLAAEVCLIDVANLDATLQRHAALHAWVGAAHEVARIEEERCRWELTRSRALALLTAKADADVRQKRAPAVALLEAVAETAPTVAAAMDALMAVAQKRGALRAMDHALEDRRDMLIQISAAHRREAEEYRR